MSDGVNDSMDGLSGAALVQGFREGNPAVVGKLYELYFVKLCDYCYYLLDDAKEAEDVVSRIFYRLLLNDIKVGRELRSLEDIGNYLYVAAKTKCLDVQRRRKTKKVVYKAVSDKPEYGLQEELDLAFAQALGDLKLLETVYKLSYRSIEVLRKLYFENKSHEEIAQEMGIARPTVVALRAKGITILAKILKREDYILHILILLITTGAI